MYRKGGLHIWALKKKEWNKKDYTKEVLVKYYITFSRLSYRWKPRTPHMAYPIQLGFQDETSPIIEELLHFHDHTLMIVFLISSLVLYIISLMLTTKLTHTSTIDAQEVETVWTILPAIILREQEREVEGGREKRKRLEAYEEPSICKIIHFYQIAQPSRYIW